jgi:hypothetical protein
VAFRSTSQGSATTVTPRATCATAAPTKTATVAATGTSTPPAPASLAPRPAGLAKVPSRPNAPPALGQATSTSTQTAAVGPPAALPQLEDLLTPATVPAVISCQTPHVEHVQLLLQSQGVSV